MRTHTAWHRRLAGGADAARSWRRTRAFRASSHGTHDALNVAHTPRLKRARTENGLAKTEPPPAAVAPACRYAYACMRTPRWKMPCSARKQLRCVCTPSQSAVVHPSHERPPSGRCGSQRSIACLQQHSGLRNDATNSVAHPLRRRIACCNSARQDRATTQPTWSPICCSGV